MEARQGRDAAGGSMRSTTARPAISQVAGDARTSTLDEQDAQDRRHVAGIGKLALLLFAAVALWPSRRSRFGDIEGRQAARGGDSPQGFPLEASEARSAPSGARRHQAESSGRRLDSETGIHGEEVGTGFTHGRRENLDHPEGQCHFGDFVKPSGFSGIHVRVTSPEQR